MSANQEAQAWPSSSDLLESLSEHSDIAEWINYLIDDSFQKGPGTIPDVTELATHLEVACQDTSSQLEQSIDDISRTVPRLTYDLHFLRESALTLKLALSSLQARLSSSIADDKTTQALGRLTYLDTVKTRMEASRDVLREAESWSTLESEVTSLLAELHYEKAAERLADASRSMVIFQNTPEYESRRALMISLQNQLEASLSSALVAAINVHDITSCKNFYAIFGHIQRESEFRNYYNGSRRASLIQFWTSTPLSDVEGEISPADASPVEFKRFLNRFFADFLSLVNEERTYTPSIFPDAQQTLSTFVQSTIDSLTPSLSQRLSGLSEHYGASALPELIGAFRAAEEFAIATDKVLEKVGYAALFSPQTPVEESNKSHSRRLSKRMSMSRRLGPSRSSSSISGGLSTGGGGAWEQALFEPFIDFQAEYQSIEKRHLDEGLHLQLENPQPPKGPMRGSDPDAARIFRERSADVFSMAEESLGRCMDFTHGYGAIGLLRSLDHVFSTFLESSRAELLIPSHAPSSSSVPTSVDTFEELDYSTADWNAIQLALHLLEACRVVRERLSVLEIKVRAGLMQVASAFRLARGDPQGLYISNTTRGEAQLLSQSTLNSADLHNLLDSLDSGGTSSAFGTPATDQSVSLLIGAKNATTDFIKACQGILRETLLSPLLQHLSTYAMSSSWSTTVDVKRDAPYDLNIPTFSLSPTPTIQRVAEGLLNLPRLFEVYADDDALAFSVETLPFVDADSLRAMLNPMPSSPSHPKSPTDPHLRRLSSSHSFGPPPVTTLPPEMVVSAWLSSLALSLLAHLTRHILPSIRTLSKLGTAQLASDLAYISNIVRALNVEWEELERWKEAVEIDEVAGRKKIAQDGLTVGVIFNTVARIRGWL